MRKIILLLSLTCLGVSSMFAQAMEKDMTMSKGVQNSFTIDLENTDDKRAEHVLKDIMKQYGKFKRDRRNDEFYVEEADMPMIEGGPLNVYIKFEEFGDMTRATFWFEEEGRFLTSVQDAAKIDGADVLFNDYKLAVKKSIIMDELDEEKDELNDLEKDFKKLEKKNEDYHRDIEKAKEDIEKAKENIEDNLEEQKEKRKEIEAQLQAVEKVQAKLNDLGI